MNRESAADVSTARWDPIPYELRIGVTGHRDLAEPKAVAAKVHELLAYLLTVLHGAAADPFGPHGSKQSTVAKLDRRCAEVLAAVTGFAGRIESWVDTESAGTPSRLKRAVRRVLWPAVRVSPRKPEAHQRTPIKLTVISALASGADQIVARTVCDVVRGQGVERNRYLEAVLPFPKAIYETDFSETELAAFRTFLALDCGATNTHPEPTVCFPHFPLTSDPAHPSGRVAREDGYAAAGRHVVDTSEILIAIWDPARARQPGGTEDTVREALDRGRLVLWLNPLAADKGWRVLRPASTPAGSAPARCATAPLPTRAKHLSQNFHRLAAYNRDSAVSARTLQRELDREAASLRTSAQECGLPAPVTQALADNLLPRFIRADLLSQRYRRLRDIAARLWPCSAAFVVTLMAFQIVFLPSQYWLAFVELAVLVLGYVANRVSVYEGWHDKWLHDRRLAEGLRSAMYAALVPGNASSIEPSTARMRHPLPFYDPGNSWYVASMKREVAKEQRRFRGILPLTDPAQRRAVSRFLQRAWVIPQAAHHRTSAARRTGVAARASRVRLGLFMAIVAVAAGHAIGVGHHDADTGPGFGRVDLWLGFLTVALPAWAGALHVILSLEDHGRFAERSKRMTTLLEGLADRLVAAQSVEELEERVAEAERLMDLESAEWAESLVDRRPEFTG